MYPTDILYIHGGQEEALDPLELEFRKSVNYYMDIRNQLSDFVRITSSC